MKSTDIYKDISLRTGGDIYIGVVGPVRTGKSTFIQNFMESLVIPSINDPHKQERAVDELPQSAAGKTIMTTEPKFVPNESVEITLDAYPFQGLFGDVRLVQFGTVHKHRSLGIDPQVIARARNDAFDQNFV